MHELSMAQSLVELASDQLAAAGWDSERERVSGVKVRIGAFSGVVFEALSTAFDVAAVGTELEGANLQIEPTDLVVWCPSCSQERALSYPQLLCPVCNARTPRIVRGMELELVSIEVVDAAAHSGSSTAHSEAQ